MEHWAEHRKNESITNNSAMADILWRFMLLNYMFLDNLNKDYSKPCRQWPDDLMKWATYRLIEAYAKTHELFHTHFPTEWQYSKSKRLHKFIYKHK